MGIIILLAVVLIALAFGGTVVYTQLRKSHRLQKSYERALDLVPLFIHLPPPSDDIEGGSRDERDVTEETISRAQSIYNIIASTYQKGFKHDYFGQQHFSFEIVGSQGFVYIYAAVPLEMLEVVKQAVISAYPTARLEEVADHNIFSQVGKINGTTGGELNLKQSFAYPIATYQELKRDTMQTLLNAFSLLGKEDGAAIQILMRPANEANWRKAASDIAKKKREGNDKKGIHNALPTVKEVAVGFHKPAEKKEDKKDLSNLESSTLDSIDDKTRYAGFEVCIRVVVSSNISQRAQAILSQIVASFSLYDAPGKNGFSFAPAKSVEDLVNSYVMRFFPQENNKNILNSVELATIFHFPDQRSIPTSQLVRQESKQVDGPRNIPDDGLLLGYNLFRGAKKPIRLGLGDRQRHMYVVGQTGTGKSTFLENLALQDMLRGNGFAFVDPHGDTAEKLLAMVPKERTEDVIYFSPADMEFPMGLNLFEFDRPEQKDFLVQESLNMLQKLYDPQHTGIMGPRYEHIFRNAALAIMADPNGGTFVDIPKLFRDPVFLKEKLQHVTDQNVLDFWQKEFPASQRSNDAGEVTAWFVSKFGAFLSNEMMRNIIGQTKSAFDLRDIMDNKKILLVNLSKGRTGDLNSKLLGMIFVMKFQAAAMSRSDIPEDDRVDFSLYVDEFQNFSTDSFATIMSEARKYHLNLIVANQFTTQLTDEIREAVFGNIGTIVSFRIGQNDVESLGRYFQPTFDSDDLLRVPNFNTIVRTLIGGVPTQPFSMVTLPALGKPNMKLLEALKQLSAVKHGRPKLVVEKEINERMTTTSVPEAAPTAPTGPNMGMGSSVPPASTGSFLDDWLSKRKAGIPSPTVSPMGQAPASTPPIPVPAPVAAPIPAPQVPVEMANTTPVPVSTGPMPIPQAAPIINTPAPVAQPATTSGQPVQRPQIVTQHARPSFSVPEPVQSEPATSQEGSEAIMPVPAIVAGINRGVIGSARPAGPASTVNISSNEIQQTEVDKIAGELKQQLNQAKAGLSAPAVTPTEDEIAIDSDGNIKFS